jgi:hypothetical protein
MSLDTPVVRIPQVECHWSTTYYLSNHFGRVKLTRNGIIILVRNEYFGDLFHF